MKNIINTKEYMKVIKLILVAIAFAVSFPFVTFADYITEDGYIVITNNDYSYNYGDYSYDYPDVSYDYPDVSYDYPDVSYDYPDVSYEYPSTVNYSTSPVSSGGYVIGGTTYTQPSTYYIPSSSVVTTGGFTGGGIQTAPSTYYVPPTSTVTSGSFQGVSPVYTQPTYTYTQPTSTYIPNQVLTYTDTNPNLDAIYLSDVPYTGLEDYAGIIIFISVLVFWSALISYLFLKKKMQTQMIFAFVNAEDSSKVDPMISNIQTQISNDSEDVRKVEEYARMNKVLLSGDASAKIVKLSRLGKINASEYIRSVATGEWIAIGESQIA